MVARSSGQALKHGSGVPGQSLHGAGQDVGLSGTRAPRMIDDVGSPLTPAALHLLPLRLYHPGVLTRDLVLGHKTDLPVTEGHVPQPWPVPLTNAINMHL